MAMAYLLIICVIGWFHYGVYAVPDRYNGRILQSVANIPDTEYQSLYDLYGATNGADWICCNLATVPWNFTDGSDPCADAWQGVLCSVTNNQFNVVTLRFESLNMTGTLPASLGNLSMLENLIFVGNAVTGGNYLSGTIPDSIGNLSKLEQLNLVDNTFLTGTIPTSIVNLTNLTALVLGQNRLTGTIPAGLGYLSLKTLYLSSNYLTGTIPTELGNILNITGFEIADNLLTGTIPSSLGQLSKSFQFYASLNLLSGTIPPELGNLSNVRIILLNENLLTGPIPESFGLLKEIRSLELFENFLSGTLPSSLGFQTTMVDMYLFFNHLTGQLPSLANMSHLQNCILTGNSISGTIPSSLGGENMRGIYLSVNSITGSIPPGFGDLYPEVRYVYLETNFLTGTIPDTIENMQGLQYLNLYDNSLSGSIPSVISQFASLVQFIASSNQLSGNLAFMSNSSALTSLTSIQVDNNQLTGTLPAEIFELQLLSTFVASVNCFTGYVPSNVCSALKLSVLILDGLSSATSCQNLIFPTLKSSSYLILHSVKGTIPSCIFQLPEISTLHLSGNGITGSLYDGTMSRTLMDLSVSHNSISGVISSEFQYRNWDNLDLSFNRISGTVETFVVSGNNSLYIENNRISGKLPSVQDIVNISILGTNMFSCNPVDEDLPPHDSDKDKYVCGSNRFNVSYYVWLCFIGGGCVVIIVVWRCIGAGEKLGVLKSFTHYKKIMSFSGPGSNGHFATIGLLSQHVLLLTKYATAFIVIILVPLYCILGHYYSTHTVNYAYSVSALFLSGVIPFWLELMAWLCFLGGMLYIHVGQRSSMYVNTSKEPLIMDNEIEDAHVTPTQSQIVAVYLGNISINFLIVGGVNTAYAFVAIYGASHTLIFYQILLSFFKLMWVAAGTEWVLVGVVKRCIPELSLKSVRRRFLKLQICLSTMNNILIPLMVVSSISPFCFYNVFVPPNSVSSTFIFNLCFIVGNQCVVPLPYQQTITYNPPFSYSYQCSFSWITYYAPVYVTMCIFSTFVLPVGRYTLQQWHIKAIPGTTWFKLLDVILPNILKPLPADESALDQISKNVSFFHRTKLIVLISMYLSLLCTVGVVFPPLAVAFSVCLCTMLFINRLYLGNMLHTIEDRGLIKYRTFLELECTGVESVDSLVAYLVSMSIWVSCFFYTFLLFDTLGDAVGFKKSYWIVIVLPLSPILLYYGYNSYVAWSHNTSTQDMPEGTADVKQVNVELGCINSAVTEDATVNKLWQQEAHG